ncbi:MAG: guanylate kinase [bacterium]
MKNKGRLFIVAAPSGAGKTSVVTNAISKLKPNIPIERVITFTTRSQRPGEVDGVDYYFLSEEEFLKRKTKNFFLETTKYNGYYYGSPSSIIQDMKNGKSFILITDTAGANNFKKNIMPDAVMIWITVSSIEELRKRLEKRKTDSPEAVEKRLKIAHYEMARETKEKNFKYHVQNNNLDDAVNEIIKIIKQNL